MIKLGYKLPPTYRLGSQGSGCAGEPPGHPRYFTRSVYTSHGTNPPYRRDNPAPNYEYKGRYFTELEDVDRYFKPLPLDHERVKAWIDETFRHHQHCYMPPGSTDWNDRIIYPVPGWQLKKFIDDPRFSHEWRRKEKAAIEQALAAIERAAHRIATGNNHDATLIIRRHYPEFNPTPELIDNPPENPGRWWETGDRPTPEQCPGQYDSKHPVNGSWCQWCGWRGTPNS